MINALMTLVDWQRQPRRIVEAGELIIETGDAAETLFYLEQGLARTCDGTVLTQDEAILLCDTLARETHERSVFASTQCHLVVVPVYQLEASLSSQHKLAWPLSRSIAADMVQRPLAG